MSVRTGPTNSRADGSRTDESPVDKRPPNHVSVAIVDDHPPIREVIRHEVKQAIDMTVATEAGSPKEASVLIQECGPDVAVVDVGFGTGQAFGLIETLKAECADMNILVFSVHEEAVYAERALRAGASGYLMKDAPMDELRGALRQVGDEEVYLSPEMTTQVLGRLQEGKSEARFPIDEFTERQLKVFEMLGQGLSVEAIADRINLARKTVETYRRRAKEIGYETIDEVVSHATRWVQAGGDGRAT